MNPLIDKIIEACLILIGALIILGIGPFVLATVLTIVRWWRG